MTVGERMEAICMSDEQALEIFEAFALIQEERDALQEEVLQLQEQASRMTTEREEALRSSVMERTILEQGGKNAKAIMALLEDGSVAFNGTELIRLDLEQVKAEAPYLFHQREEKIGGTGYSNSGKEKSDIGKAFKHALRR